MDSTKENKYIFSILQNEIDELEKAILQTAVVDQKIELVGKINLIKNSKELLKRCFEYNLKPKSIWRRIPKTEYVNSEYRIFEDFESENKDTWKELDYFRLDGNEVIIG